MNNKNILLYLIILILVALAAVYFFYPSQDENADNGDIAIKERFDNKIVYTLDQDQSSEKYSDHCSSLGGDFDTCGSPCAPDADICTSVCAYTCENLKDSQPEDTNKDNNLTDYNNYRYGFGVKYQPVNWEILENKGKANTVFINIYKKDELNSENLALDHFANASHVSFYPNGIPTEGISAQSTDFNIQIEGISNQNSRLYVLKDGTPFAALLKPEEKPESWNEAGFIWVRTFIADMDSECLREGELVDSSQCNPLSTDDEIIMTGLVDDEVWQEQIDMIKTLKFFRNNQDDLIYLESPLPKETIESPLTISGEARGQWFFEASFSAVLVDWDGRIINESVVTTEDDWMSEEYIPFTSELRFESPYNEGDPDFMKRGSLILQKANPSGLPENDNALEIEIEY